MSWNVQYASRAAFQMDLRSFSNGEVPADQLAEARAAVEGIMTSGCVGDDSREFHMAIFGHTNPEHAPMEGVGADCLTITVTQKKPERIG